MWRFPIHPRMSCEAGTYTVDSRHFPLPRVGYIPVGIAPSSDAGQPSRTHPAPEPLVLGLIPARKLGHRVDSRHFALPRGGYIPVGIAPSQDAGQLWRSHPAPELLVLGLIPARKLDHRVESRH